jgi:hypothetical protein
MKENLKIKEKTILGYYKTQTDELNNHFESLINSLIEKKRQYMEIIKLSAIKYKRKLENDRIETNKRLEKINELINNKQILESLYKNKKIEEFCNYKKNFQLEINNIKENFELSKLNDVPNFNANLNHNLEEIIGNIKYYKTFEEIENKLHDLKSQSNSKRALHSSDNHNSNHNSNNNTKQKEKHINIFQENLLSDNRNSVDNENNNNNNNNLINSKLTPIKSKITFFKYNFYLRFRWNW